MKRSGIIHHSTMILPYGMRIVRGYKYKKYVYFSYLTRKLGARFKPQDPVPIAPSELIETGRAEGPQEAGMVLGVRVIARPGPCSGPRRAIRRPCRGDEGGLEFGCARSSARVSSFSAPPRTRPQPDRIRWSSGSRPALLNGLRTPPRSRTRVRFTCAAVAEI
jgi:hypothetical protein